MGVRVLALTNMWPYDGDPSYGAFVAAQVRSAQECGASVEVIFVNGRRNTWAYLAGAFRMLLLNVRPRRYDLIHAHTGHCATLARLQFRYPVLVSYVGYDVYGKLRADGSITLKSRVERVVFRQLARIVAATITKSSAMEALLPASAQAKNVVLPNGVDRREFTEVPREQARAVLGWGPDEVVVLFAGRTDVARKRVDVAREACLIAAREIDGVRLRILEGHEHGVVPLWMSAADVLVLPSLAEGSPNVVKEALACNLPVVAGDVGDVAQVIGDAVRCRVLDRAAGPAEFGAALVEVLRGAPARSNGRALTAHLGADVIARRLLELYERTAKGARSGAVQSRGGDLASL